MQHARFWEVIAMEFVRALAAAIVGAASLSLLAQQPVASTAPAPEETAPQIATSPAEPAAAMSPVAGELMNELDSKTAKAGDRVVLKTKSAVRAADGTEIPKDSKLIGYVVAAKPTSATDANAQLALQFDRVELKSGQILSIHSEIQALSPPARDAANARADAAAPSPSPSSGGRSPGDMYGSSPSPMADTRIGSGGLGSETSSNVPASGTLVGRTGNIAIRATSIPGVLLAVIEGGHQDPRRAQSSGILLGAKRDIHLDQGTNVVIGVAASGANTVGNDGR
jgi:hypothetical protein